MAKGKIKDYLKLRKLIFVKFIRKIFVKFNTPLPSSAPVERLFSYATLLDLPKYNKMTDAQI